MQVLPCIIAAAASLMVPCVSECHGRASQVWLSAGLWPLSGFRKKLQCAQLFALVQLSVDVMGMPIATLSQLLMMKAASNELCNHEGEMAVPDA